ncbi:LysM peptidoglycan-binding domain-containing protein [Undibacterium umbellatum]|uniref:LysM peptidoglycan-binding domain-containing protein n=1 Tax=Undibacterium umbellatum TaxID=2762300 RepID=A0ABR6ZGT2_9BURK|nr:LysM domain-containing protein [Undibacterium umbellatum]MBC3910940.1 LysM peptidoglycan-binding domain-containing protein [Undibacterium umbellatum]
MFKYTVLAGDTLNDIAAALSSAAGVSVQAIEAANPGVNANALQIGTLLNIPAQLGQAIALKYTIQSGDSYSIIAANLAGCTGLSFQEIEQANPSVNPNAMAVGQVLTIPISSASLTSPIADPTIPLTQSVNAQKGLWYWTWSKNTQVPDNTNLGIAFSGWVSPQTAIDNSNAVHSQLPGLKYICLGGGNESGAWTESAVLSVTNAINSGSLSAYQGIAYDIEEGSSGLAAAFEASFTAAKAKGLKVLVTVSHSAPYGIEDAAALMRSFFASPVIDILSPQLYTTGEETSNQYATSGGVSWSEYADAKAIVAPSIVNASLYADAQEYFLAQGVSLGGFLQWQQ